MQLNTKSMRSEFRSHFGVDGCIKIKIKKHPRKDEVKSFVFCDNTVSKGDMFFDEIKMVLENAEI